MSHVLTVAEECPQEIWDRVLSFLTVPAAVQFARIRTATHRDCEGLLREQGFWVDPRSFGFVGRQFVRVIRDFLGAEGHRVHQLYSRSTSSTVEPDPGSVYSLLALRVLRSLHSSFDFYGHRAV